MKDNLPTPEADGQMKNQHEETPTSTPASQQEHGAEEIPSSADTAPVEAAQEAQPVSEDHEDADDHPEVESDEHEEDHYSHEPHELPDYAAMDEEHLVQAAEAIAKQGDLNESRKHLEAIRTVLMPRFLAERNEKLDEFIQGGGNEIDFEFRQPLREKFKQVYSAYKDQRRKHLKEVEAQLSANLDRKKQLIDQLKELIDNQEHSDKDLWQEFKQLQESWKSTGPVPRTESNNLWQTYHFHVDRFFDLIKMNHELRDMEFKRNLEVKEEIAKKAEELATLEDVKQAFQGLQQLHKDWKNVGPVPREHRDSIWERFSAATKSIHDKRHLHFEGLAAEREERLKLKRDIVERLNAVSTERSNHQAWQAGIEEVNAILTAFKAVGRIPGPENDKVWEDLRAANRKFNKAKNEFYKSQKHHQLENLRLKRALLERAEALKDSDDFKNATRELKEIQAKWKTIGHVPRSESDKIWKAFRAACNHYFDRLGKRHKEQDAAFSGNLEVKKGLLVQLEQLVVKAEDEASVEALKTLINQWKTAGPVPRDEREIETTFNNLLDHKFAELKLDRRETQRIRFENKVQSMAEGGDNRQLRRERDALVKKLDEAKKELKQLENNIGFFTSSKANNPLLMEVERRIERQRELVESIVEKIDILDQAGEEGE